jgi:hypothetical protein
MTKDEWDALVAGDVIVDRGSDSLCMVVGWQGRHRSTVAPVYVVVEPNRDLEAVIELPSDARLLAFDLVRRMSVEIPEGGSIDEAVWALALQFTRIRYSHAWLLKQSGLTHAQIAEAYGFTAARAQQMVAKIEGRLCRKFGIETLPKLPPELTPEEERDRVIAQVMRAAGYTKPVPAYWKNLVRRTRRNHLACADNLYCGGDETFVRASGDCICDFCKMEYRDHSFCKNSAIESHSPLRPDYVLHVLCDGRHVKL